MHRWIRQAQKVFLAFCASFFIIACSAPCRNWYLQQIVTTNPCFNSGRLVLPPESDSSRLRIELARSPSGIRLYFNILFLQAAPLSDDPLRTEVEIVTDEGSYLINPYILQGGQRLLIHDEDADHLIALLLNGKCFSIKMGRHQTEIISEQFAETYAQLLALPIAY
ncbi:MAG: hypothetical protein H0V82_06935 [Candidatus Protochlamydia sp.]|nr:hypothetical protein [Candidatus Protochlamydia sp.]